MAATTTSSNPNLECRMYEAQYPEVDAVTMAEVKHIEHGTASVSLLEYGNIDGVLSFQEIDTLTIQAPRRFVRTGQKLAAMVLRTDPEKGYVHLTKRQVSDEDVQECNERYRKSKLVHSIMRRVAEATGIDLEHLYEHVGWPLYRTYGHAFEAFKLIMSDPDSVLGSLTRKVKEVTPDGQEVVPALTPKVKDVLVMNIRSKMKPLKIRAIIKMMCFHPDGVKHIKEAMKKAEAASSNDCQVTMRMAAAPFYVLRTQNFDKEQGISVLNNAIKACTEEIERHQGNFQVKEAPRVVSGNDDKSLDEHTAERFATEREHAGVFWPKYY